MYRFFFFPSNRTGDTCFNNPIFMEQTQLKDNFFSKQSKHGPSKRMTWKRVLKHTTFPWRKLKIIKCERRTIETSINNSFVGERVFYHLNEQFVSDITGDIIFSTRFLEHFKQLTFSQATCWRMLKHRTFPPRKNN